MRILHTADVHLRSEKDERWEALHSIIKLAEKEKADAIAISGDLFDRGVDAEKLRPAIRKLFSGSGSDIVLIPGNHDSDSYGGGLYFGEDIRVITDPFSPVIIEDVRIWGIPFQDLGTEDMAKLIKSFSGRIDSEKTDILLYHGELLDSFYSRRDFGDEGEHRYMPVKLSFFRDLEVDYVLAGHFHTRFQAWELQAGGFFVYPGSPVSITRRETGKRCVNIFDTGGEPREHFLETPYFEKLEVILNPLSGENPLEEVKCAVEEVPPEASILLTVGGYINSREQDITENDLAKEIRRVCGERCPDAPEFLVRDIGNILSDGLFRSFERKLKEREYGEEFRGRVREIAIGAMMEAGQ